VYFDDSWGEDMSFFQTVKRWAEQNSERYIYTRIPPIRTDVEISNMPLKPDESYFRIWLNEMHLANSREWFTEWYPAVQASVNLRFGGEVPMTYSRIVRAPNEALTRGVLINYPLTELLPYRGGVVEVEAALMAFKGTSGTDYIGSALGLLENFGGLVSVPLGQAVQVAQAVNKGIDDLIAVADGRVHLSLHQALISGSNRSNSLREGFLAVILATPEQLDRTKLSVRENRLLYDGGLLTGYDYMLLQIESRSERDDWELSYIDNLMDKIANAYAFGKTGEAKTFQEALKVAVFDSNDFTFKDKVRVLRAIARRIEILRQPFFQSDENGNDSDRRADIPERPSTLPGAPSAEPAPTPPSLNEMIKREQGFFPNAADMPKTEEDLLKIF